MKHLNILFALLLICSVTACTGNSRKPDTSNPDGQQVPSTPSEQQAPSTPSQTSNSIEMLIDKSVYPLGTEEIELTITNNTQSEATTGEYFTLYHYKDGSWQQIPLELFFIDIAYILQPGEARDFTISLHTDMYDYTKGKYKVGKTVNGQPYSAEFKLE